MYADFGKSTKSNIHEKASLSQSTKLVRATKINESTEYDVSVIGYSIVGRH